MTHSTTANQVETILESFHIPEQEAEKFPVEEVTQKKNAFKINLENKKDKPSKQLGEYVKKYNLNWFTDEKAYTCSLKTGILLEADKELREQINFSLEEVYDPYHDLLPNEQQAEKLENVERIKIKKWATLLGEVKILIKDYNCYWKERSEDWKKDVTITDIQQTKKEDLKNLLKTTNPRELLHLEILHDRYITIKKEHDEAQKLNNKASKLRSKKEPTEIRYGNFVVDAKGLYYFPEDNESNEQGENEENKSPKKSWISSPIWPEAYLRDKEGKSHTLLIRVHDGERDHKITLPRRVITKWAELSEILLDLGQSVPTLPANQKHLQNFIMQARPAQLMRCVDKSGWHGDQYIFPDGEVLGKTKDNNENVHPINEACPKGIEKKGSLQEWQDNVLKLCANNTRLIFSIGVSLSAPCLQLVGDEGGVFNFKGVSSIGKTRCLMVAISVFGSPEFKRSWRATANGLEAVCSLHNDCLLALDEFGQSDAKEVGQIAYMYSQGIGKLRSEKVGGVPREPKTWRGMLFSTGEVGISDHMQDDKNKPKAGQLVRVIDIPAQIEGAFGCFEELHGFENGIDGEKFADKIKEVCGEYYGTAGREFIKAMIEYGVERSKKYLKFSRDDFAANVAAKYDGQVKRVANRFGLVYASLSLGIELGVFSKYLTKEMAEKAVKHCFHDWLNDRGTTGNFESHSIINQVVGMLNENSDSKFIPKNDVDDKRIRPTLWGYKDGAIFYVFPKAFKENLCKGFDEKSAISSLKDIGILLPGKNKSSQTVRIPAHSKTKKDRFYVIDLDKQQEDEEDVTC